MQTHNASSSIVEYEQLNKTLLTLTGEIAHELKTPLSIIQLYTEIIENSVKNVTIDKNIANNFETIKRTIRNANCLINIFLTQLKGLANREIDNQNFKSCSIATDVSYALEQYPFQANEKKLVTAYLDNDFEYIGNSILTHHIIFNLVKNAIRAIKNGEKGAISINLNVSKTYNQLIFKDTATGISKHLLPNIFDQFEKGQITSHCSMGLGLALCKMMMQFYGGKITCCSQEGKYTEFVLSFPVVAKNRP